MIYNRSIDAYKHYNSEYFLYESVWAMVHKLRKAMGNRDASYTLEGMIETDEGYFYSGNKAKVLNTHLSDKINENIKASLNE